MWNSGSKKGVSSCSKGLLDAVKGPIEQKLDFHATEKGLIGRPKGTLNEFAGHTNKLGAESGKCAKVMASGFSRKAGGAVRGVENRGASTRRGKR